MQLTIVHKSKVNYRQQKGRVCPRAIENIEDLVPHQKDVAHRIDLRVAAVKSTESTWPLHVKSSRFSSKSPPKFSTQVAAEFWDKSHDL